ncbi:hypothetical protein IFO70_09115 [Phormidium tenue FACHB-886]|nr:hypothetical protein [Phormidium tenue FACHB-886]
MLAVGLTITLFVFWAVVGQAVLAILDRQDNLLRRMLLAPVVGIATMLLPLFWLNRLGLPVKTFGATLAIGLLAVSVGILWRVRPKLPWREYLPFTSIFLAALFLTGRPMLEFGFDWLSYANDDMANYCLAAERLLQYSFFSVPDIDQVMDGKDYSLFYWFMHVPGVIRTGSEFLLAWVCSWTGLTPHQVFMPTILALHVILISAVGALVAQTRALYQASLITCVLISISALNSLGTVYQLIAQVGGLALLSGTLTGLVALPPTANRAELIRWGILVGLLGSSLLITYPEVLPFLVLAFLLFAVVQRWRRQMHLGRSGLFLAAATLTCLLLLNSHFLKALGFLQAQAGAGTKQVDLQESYFPYYLMPSGLANFWSLLQLSSFPKEPWLSVAIALGAFLLVTAVCVSLFLMRSGVPIASLTVVMLGIGLVLFWRENDFGLFKLAMFIQPFLIGTLVVWWVSTARRPLVKLIPLVLLGMISLSTQQFGYVESSRGIGKSIVEIPNASEARINTEFQTLLSSIPPSQPLLLDTANVVMAKFQALYTAGRTALFPSRNFYEPIAAQALGGLQTFPDRQLNQITQSLLKRYLETYQHAEFDLRDPQRPSAKNPFNNLALSSLAPNPASEPVLVSTTSLQDIFNNRRFKIDAKTNGNLRSTANFSVQSLNEIDNLLIFVHSELGQHYYLGETKHISLYQLEKDYFFPEEQMSGVGRHFLFEVIHPAPQVRLELNMTASLKNDKGNELPPAEAIGTSRQAFGIVGRGSAHVFSPPLSAQVIEEHNFVGIDMGVEGKRFPSRKTGLMNLYGKDIPTDRRKLVGFGRDISLVSEEEYAALNPPTHLQTFPDDLAHADLEYSGAYEDGWISEAAFFSLKQPSPALPLRLEGTVPEIKDPGFSTALAVSVDGKEIARQLLKPGQFKLNLPLPAGGAANRRRIDLRFSQFQNLPVPDNRPIAAKLNFIGFTENG